MGREEVVLEKAGSGIDDATTRAAAKLGTTVIKLASPFRGSTPYDGQELGGILTGTVLLLVPRG